MTRNEAAESKPVIDTNFLQELLNDDAYPKPQFLSPKEADQAFNQAYDECLVELRESFAEAERAAIKDAVKAALEDAMGGVKERMAAGLKDWAKEMSNL